VYIRKTVRDRQTTHATGSAENILSDRMVCAYVCIYRKRATKDKWYIYIYITIKAFSCDYIRFESVLAGSKRFATMTYGVSRQFYRRACDGKRLFRIPIFVYGVSDRYYIYMLSDELRRCRLEDERRHFTIFLGLLCAKQNNAIQTECLSSKIICTHTAAGASFQLYERYANKLWAGHIL